MASSMVVELIWQALREFADAVAEKMQGLAPGEPEDQLRSPFEVFVKKAGAAVGRDVVSIGESKLPNRLGRPDYAVLSNKLLAGYAELKAPGVGVRPGLFKGHDRRQWERFKALPNLLYLDGTEWGLYRTGDEVRPIVRLCGDMTKSGSASVVEADAEALTPMLTDFLYWEPQVPSEPKELAKFVAPICRLLRDDVHDSLADTESALVHLARDWRHLLFPDATNEQFADAYAQTVIFALLLARSEGGGTLDLTASVTALSAKHTLLSKALEILTDPLARAEIAPSLRLAQRVIDRVPIQTMAIGKKDPWLYFYEDFLAEYDPDLRRDAGAYYTPVEVVRAQVRLADEVLSKRMGFAYGFAAKEVVTLDPAVGTGTYLLGVIQHALGRVEQFEGAGAVPARGTVLAANLYGFEIMVGPYAVAELRVTRALSDRAADLPQHGPHIYLTDTLESPNTEPPQPPLILRAMADQHARALQVKQSVPVIVCLGNPPYDRHAAVQPGDWSRSGSWVRWGDEGSSEPPILTDFTEPARAAGHGVDLKNLYNLYVYFWRWALWKVFEQQNSEGGIVSFISASSYLDGDAFAGMRERLRRICDEVWVIDLGGEGRGTRRDENVFAIQTPVCIGLAVRYGAGDRDQPAIAHYTRLEGTRARKLALLDSVGSLADLKWELCSDDWQAPLHPIGAGDYFRWPLLTDILPWQHSGSQFKRTWPIAPDQDTLRRRWRTLLQSADRAALFKETRDRKIGREHPPLLASQPASKSIAQLPVNAPVPLIARYGFRSFDRQYAMADSRLGDFLRPQLWRTQGPKQVFLTSLLTSVLGDGPALMATADVPDLHHFCGRGAKDAIPVYRDAAGQDPNMMPGLLELLRRHFKRPVSAEDLIAYIYGLLAHPGFTSHFSRELETRQLRVPLTKDKSMFSAARRIGRKLLWLHTFGERFVPEGLQPGDIPAGQARAFKPVSQDPQHYPQEFGYVAVSETLVVGDGEFRPVPSEVWEFAVSGWKVLPSWLGYRMQRRRGKHSSPLDDIGPKTWTADFTSELLRTIWIIESTIAEYPRQDQLLLRILSEDLFTEPELPAVPKSRREGPEPEVAQQRLAGLDRTAGDWESA